MSEEEKEVKTNQISRREFLKDAGLIVGGATVGSMALVNACGATKTVTSTVAGGTSTKTVTSTATTTVPGGTGVVTTTVTAPGGTTTVTATATGAGAASFTDPIDGTTWPSLDALKAHFNIAHPNADANIVGLNVNGTDYAVLVKPYWSLARVLRESLGMFALKEGCNLGECGACTVNVDDKAVFSCMILACEAENMKVLTVEGLSNNGKLSPLQQKWYDNEVWQCGFCTPGFLMAANALLKANAKPTIADVRLAFSGHLCMCGDGHRHINATVGGL